MSQPVAITSVQITLANGTTLEFGPDDILPGAYYSISRNFTKPHRKRAKNEPKEIAETWLSHNVHFITDRETEDNWQKKQIKE